jgi:hypothetical protein
VRVEAVIHGYPCNRYKQKSRRLLVFSRGAVTPLVTPRRKMGKLWIYFPESKCVQGRAVSCGKLAYLDQ